MGAALVTLAGCAALPFSGYAVEVTGAATRLSPTRDANAAATDGTGVTVGVSVTVEVDYARTSGMGAGLAYLSTDLPRSDGVSSRKGHTAAQYDVNSALTRLGTDDLRPRMYAGLLAGGQSSGDLIYAAFLGAGVSYHPSRGRALHLFTGPHALGLESHDDDLAYTGLGWFVRARYYRSFVSRCDVLPSAAARQVASGHKGPVRCER